MARWSTTSMGSPATRGRRWRLRYCASPFLLQFANSDVAQFQRTGMVALDAEIPFRCLPEVGKFLGVELAGLDGGIPVGAADVVRCDVLAIQPVLDMASLGDDAGLVPLVGGTRGVLGSREEVVGRAGE